PQTPILVALMAYFRHAKVREYSRKLSKLVSMAYRAVGSRDYSEGDLRKLWQRNPSLRKHWERRLGLTPILGKTSFVPPPVIRPANKPIPLGRKPTWVN